MAKKGVVKQAVDKVKEAVDVAAQTVLEAEIDRALEREDRAIMQEVEQGGVPSESLIKKTADKIGSVVDDAVQNVLNAEVKRALEQEERSIAQDAIKETESAEDPVKKVVKKAKKAVKKAVDTVLEAQIDSAVAREERAEAKECSSEENNAPTQAPIRKRVAKAKEKADEVVADVLRKEVDAMVAWQENAEQKAVIKQARPAKKSPVAKAVETIKDVIEDAAQAVLEAKVDRALEREEADIQKEALARQAEASKKKILFVASEALPYVKTGGLADVAGALPKALCKAGYETRVMIPLYMDISNELRRTMQFVGHCYVTLAWRYQYCGVFQQQYQGVTYYFLDNEYYFKRRGLYGHYDDGERFAFFAKAVLESLRLIDFKPDILHCNDWHTALVPTFLDTFYRGMEECRDLKTVFTIHNIEFQGKYGDGLISDVLGLPVDKRSLVYFDGCVNYMKGGIECANRVTTVSPTYAREIMTPFYGYDLQNILSKRQYKLSGIINGIDTVANNPATDTALFANYSLETIQDKALNKRGLQNLLGLPENPDVPMIGMVGRLTHQKGLDLLAGVIERVLNMNLQLVILGTGDWKYENMLRDMQSRYPGKLRAIINFSGDMASKIYAASDLFLMPSKFEPCGLSQMIAMRYGSVPIVRETGGLKDTVIPYDHTTGEGVGFTFYSYDKDDLLYAVERAVGLYYDYKNDWVKVRENGMKMDFGWDNIAKQYIDLYDNI